MKYAKEAENNIILVWNYENTHANTYYFVLKEANNVNNGRNGTKLTEEII